MALTTEILRGNRLLSGLTDEQIGAITILSQNDESSTIGARFGEVYRQMDETIESALGIKRNGDEKTYKFLERASKEFASRYADYDELKGKADRSEAEIKRLQKLVDEGALDKDTANALNQAKADLNAISERYGKLKTEYETARKQWEKDMFDTRVVAELTAAKSGVKIRPDANPQVVSLAMKEAMSKIVAMNPKFEDDGKGGQVLMFHNEDGTRLNNVDNNLLPYTAKELLSKELEVYDIVDRQQRTGTGSSSPKPQKHTLQSAATQVQAVDAINRSLSERGIVKGTREYQEAFDKAYDEGNVASLPLGE